MTRYISEDSDIKRVAAGEWDIRQLYRRPAPVGRGTAIYAIEVFENLDALVVGDEAFEWEIPEDLDEAVLIKVEAYVTTASSSGPVEVQVHNQTQAVDMLSTKISIDVGDLNSKDAATPPVVNPANEEVAWGDHLRIDVDSIGTGTTGLGCILYFTPLNTGAVAFRGQQGPPGGLTQFQGPWTITNNYVAGDIITHNGVTYVVTDDHTAAANTEPGVGVDWEDFLAPLVEFSQNAAIELLLSAQTYTIDTGIKGFVEVPFDCEIVQATMIADIVGSIVVDIWKTNYGSAPPTNTDSITGATPLTISASIKTQDTSLTGWTTALSEDDILAFHVDSASTIQRVMVSLKLERT